MVGSNALAAVGSSTSIINMLISFSQGASAGAGVIISQYLGAGQKKYVQEAVHTAMAMAILLGLVLSVGGVLLSHPLLIWMRTPEEVLKDSTAYLRLYFAGTIFNVIYNMSSGILNAAGNSQRSLIYLAIASVTNIGLDLVLVGGFQMGVSGAAVATDISQFVSSLLAVGYLMRTRVPIAWNSAAFVCTKKWQFGSSRWVCRQRFRIRLFPSQMCLCNPALICMVPRQWQGLALI